MTNLETTEVTAIELARAATIKEEIGHSFVKDPMTWKEYCAVYDKHLSAELTLAKVIF